MDVRSRSSTPRNEEICGGLTNAHSTDTGRGSNNGAELNYPALEKLILALALIKPEKSRRVAKWAIELGEHDIVFQKRGDDKKEMPKYFLIEVLLEESRKEAEGRTDTKSENTKLSYEWKLYTNGAASSDGSGVGLMLIDPEGKEYTYALRFRFETTKNKAEYEALLPGLRIAQDMEIISLAIFVDSQLLVNQIKGTYAAKQPMIREYLQKTKEVLKGFDSYTIEHIRRNQNKKADALSKLASMTFEHLTKNVLVEVLSKRSIEEKEILQVETKEEESRMTPIYEYLVSGLLPKDPKESRKIRVKAPQYKLIRGSLYRRTTLNGGQNYEARILLVVDAQRSRKDLCKGLKVTQSFSHVTEHMEIMNHIEKQLTQSQQGWLDDLAQVLWIHRTLPINSQKETLFSLTYGSEAIIPIAKNAIAKDDRGRT
ncbi:reverse transcriptase domain-containing protein [Tanacetum coccineum]|uniref:Reverse transcriptase domain-containing protein n=1 Tax=Tanacetum coccineum TaxID=301880 RepID=A0ABQ5BHL8_9ASTR